MGARVLVIGSGAREHAIAWKLRQSPQLDALNAAPGNPGMAELADMSTLHIPKPGAPALEVEGFLDATVALAREARADLVVVGPEDPLSFGLVDRLNAEGFAAFGPSKRAAEIEWSKSFAKGLMRRHGIPLGEAAEFSDFDAAKRYVESRPGDVVVKADGLIAGKGAIVTSAHAEAISALRALMLEGALGASGRTVVVEDRLIGPETSAHAFSDGRTIVHMPFACDHKPVFDGNRGPNTGGMGAYSPPAWLSDAAAAAIRSEVTEQAARAMSDEGRPYRGVLFPGILMTPAGPRVLEFNSRFGDPEAEVLLPRLQSDLLDIMLGVARGTLAGTDVRWSDDAAVTVMLASGGYPERYETGKPIIGLDEVDADVVVFHAGTEVRDGQLVTAGGRVLAVTALGPTVEDARAKVYSNVARIHFDGAHFRTDIGATATAVPA